MKKNWLRKNWLSLILGIAALTILAVRFYGNPKSMRFDNLSLQSLDGQQVDMAQFEGKPVFLHFWATWCGPCQAEMPSIIAAQEAMGDDVAFVLVSDEKIKTLERFQQQKGKVLPIYHKTSTIKLKGVFSIPQTYLIDKNGDVVQSIEGAANWNTPQAKAALKALL
ncbi:MAG: TlpA family protein disulfide reductase [Bacteroidia bacterium]